MMGILDGRSTRQLQLSRYLTATNGGWAFWSLYLLFSMLGAMALHFLVEKPFLKLKDRPGLQANPGSLKTAKTQ